MNDRNVNEIDIRKNKLAVIGFSLMLAGPATLFLSDLIQNLTGNFPEIIALIIMITAIILPIAGVVLGIISLVLWKKSGIIGRVLSIVTVTMCNPFFLLIYIFICGISGSTLAGLSWM